MALENRSDSGAVDACGPPPVSAQTFEERCAAVPADRPDLLAALIEGYGWGYDEAAREYTARHAPKPGVNQYWQALADAANETRLDRPERAD